MMEEFKIIYKILKILHDGMDVEEISPDCISAESLGISFPKWSRIMALLVENGYVKGITFSYSFNDQYPRIKISRPEITMAGLEYLEDNTFMKRAGRFSKGIKDSIPGL